MKGSQFEEDPDEGFLGDIFGQRRIAEKMPKKSPHLPLIGAYQLGEGFLVAGRGRPDQGWFGFFHGFSRRCGLRLLLLM
jgi:hypothetical protein